MSKKKDKEKTRKQIKAEKAKTAKYATIQDLIVKKKKKEQSKTELVDVYVEASDIKLKCIKPSDELVLDVLDAIGDDKSMANMAEAYVDLIYNCYPLIQNPENQKELGVVDPKDAVREVFEIGERFDIGNQLMKNLGFADIDEDIKN